MCYQKPVELLDNLLEAVPLAPNDRGFTAMDDSRVLRAERVWPMPHADPLRSVATR
ncbi:hypothetical protein QF001_000720 [Paraburkholderia youngii]